MAVKVLSVSYPPNEAALVWSVGASDSGSARVRISYILGNLSKSFAYRAVATRDETKLVLAQYMRLQNLANEEYGKTEMWAGFGKEFLKPIGLNADGKEIWSMPTQGAWGVTPLANGNILVVERSGVREVNRAKETVWSWSRAEQSDYKINNLQMAWRLPNGNTLINNWVNQWQGPIDKATAPVQAIEVTPEKKVAWALRSWADPDLGPATTIQILGDNPPIMRRLGTSSSDRTKGRDVGRLLPVKSHLNHYTLWCNILLNRVPGHVQIGRSVR